MTTFFTNIWVLRGLMGVILVVGTLTAFYGFRAWHRTGSRPLFYMGVGFTLISLAAALSGVIYEILTHDLLTAWIVTAAFSAAGFLVIFYSLVAREPVSPQPPETSRDPGVEATGGEPRDEQG